MTSSLRSFVVGRQTTLDGLRQQPGSPVLDMVQPYVLDDYSMVPATVLDQAQCLFVEVDPGKPKTLQRIEDIRRRRPDLPLIAMISAPEFQLTRALIRQGVHDVVSLPLQADDVIASIMDVGAKFVTTHEKLAPVVAIASPTGGSGATTIITHLGAAIAQAGQRQRCCIVDLDIQFGDVASYFGLKSRTSVVDLLEAGDRLDGLMVRDAAIDTRRGPYVIAAPAEINPIEEIDGERLRQLLHICRSEFDVVLLDLPANWTNWVLATARACDHLLLLAEPSLHSIRRARRCLDLFESVGMGRAEISLLINRTEKRLFREIDVDDVTETLHRPAIGAIPLEKRSIAKAQDQGLLLQEVARSPHFEAAIKAVAEQLLEKLQGVGT